MVQCAVLPQLTGAVKASRDVGLDVASVPSIELAVEQSVEQNLRFCAGHAGNPSSACHAARSMKRARASRDITVPTGAPMTSAISR